MLSSITSCGLTGINGFQVTAEVNLSNGMPMFEIVGLPDASVKESRERVRAALKNSGCESKMVLFHGENHELSRSGKPRNRIRRMEEILAWMDKYLK